MSTEDIELAYRLPITTVSIDGTSTKVTNPYGGQKSKTSRSSNIAVQIEADPQRLWVVRLPDPAHSKATCAVGLAPDGRLTSTDATVDDQSQARLLSLVKAGAGAISTLLPVASMFLAPGLAPAVGLGAMAIRAASTRGIASISDSLTYDATGDAEAHAAGEDDSSETGRTPPPDTSAASATPSLEDLGIHRAYLKHDSTSAHLLANLRWSQARVEAKIAVAATLNTHSAKSLVRELSDLNKALQQIRVASVESESKYATWIASHTKSESQAFHEVFVLEELPSTQTLEHAAADGKVRADLDGNEQRWWEILTHLRVAVSWDLEDTDPHDDTSGAPLGVPPAQSPECVVFRRPRLATIIHWSAEPLADEAPASAGDEARRKALDEPVRYRLTEISRERKVVIVREGSLSYIPLRPMKPGTFKDKPRGDSVTGLTFDKDGILTKVSTERTDPSLARAATIEALPGIASDVITAGTAALKPFTSAGETERLKAELDLLKAKKDLEKAKAPRENDPLADLRATVEKAELDARQARAEAIVSDPTSSLIQISVSDPAATTDDEQENEDGA